MVKNICISMLGLTVLLIGQTHTDESITVEALMVSRLLASKLVLLMTGKVSG